jgi:ribonuclease-3
VQPAKIGIHSKDELAKKIMGKGIKLKYINESPPIQLDGGIQTFFIGVYLTGWGWKDQHLGSGKGLNKTGAGNEAASKALANRPLIDDIAAIKIAFDEKVKAEREQATVKAN